MKISRFYQKGDFNVGQDVELSTVNHRHAIQVLRLKVGESLILFNGKEGEYQAKIARVEKRSSSVLLESFDAVDRESPLKTRLVLAMIKPDKMDFAIQKAVELGVTIIQPVYTKRSVIKIKANRLDKKMQHWNGIIVGACEQSGRTSIPELKEPQTLEQSLKERCDDLGIVMLPGASNTFSSLGDIDTMSRGVSLFIGPEGGFSNEEEQLLLDSQLEGVSFGCRILRAETAVISGLTACQQRWGDL